MRPAPFNEVYTVTRPADTVGYTATVPVPCMGREGRLEYVSIREHVATEDEATAGRLIITDGEASDIDASTLQSDMAYEESGIVFAGSATDDSNQDNIAERGGILYQVRNGATVCKVAVEVTAAGGGGGTSYFDVAVRGVRWR